MQSNVLNSLNSHRRMTLKSAIGGRSSLVRFVSATAVVGTLCLSGCRSEGPAEYTGGYEPSASVAKAASTNNPNPTLAVRARVQSFPAPTHPDGKIDAANDGMVLGAGFSSIEATVKQQCVVFPKDALSQPSGSERVDLKFREASSLQEVSEIFSVNSTIAMGMGVYSGDGQFSYTRSSDFSEYGNNLILHETVENQRELLDPRKVELTPLAKHYLGQGLGVFLANCGDEYISGQIQGGSLDAIFNFDSSSQREQEQTRMTLKGHSLTVDGSLSVSHDLDEIRKQDQTDIVIGRAGPADAIPKLTIEAIVEYARGLPQKVQEHQQQNGSTPWIGSYIMTGYDQLIGQALLSPEQTTFFDKNIGYSRYLYERKGGLRFIKEHPSQFGSYTPRRLDEEVAKVDVELAKVRKAASECAQQSAACITVTPAEFSRLPGRLDTTGWLPLDPASSAPKPVGSSYEGNLRVVEVTGRWYPHKQNPGTISNAYFLYFVNRQTLERHMMKYPGSPILVPAGYDVSVVAADNEFGDNQGETGNLPQIRSFNPVFQDEFPLASNYWGPA
jgi:hypothetical protein